MPSTFMGIELAKRGLSVHQQALQTTGHNISNADNKHYARQRVNMQSMAPIYEPTASHPTSAGMIGQGAMVRDIERIRDHFVDKKINEAEQTKNYWVTKQSYLHQTEIIYNEPSEQSLRTQLDRFWQSWQELSQFPEELSHREQVRTRAQQLTFQVRHTFENLFALRRQADFDLKVNVEQVNNLAIQVRELNERIMKARSLGDNPNDLLDRRDQLLQDMAQLADITIERIDPDELIVYLGGEMLVQGEERHEIYLEGDATNEGLLKAKWRQNNKDVSFQNGKIRAILEARDVILKENIEKLDLFAINLADIINEVHRDGFGLTKETNIDFFKINSLANNVQGNFDLNGDGQNDISAVFKISGKNALAENKPVGIAGTLTLSKNNEEHTSVYITYRPDETLGQIIKRINKADAGVVAYMNHNNQLVLKGRLANDDWQKNFLIRHIEDSGELLVGFSGMLQNSGPAGAFDYTRLNEIYKLQSNLDQISLAPTFHPSEQIQLSDSVKGNVALIAAAAGKDVGGTGDVNRGNGSKDGSNATRIAQAMKHKNTMIGRHNTPDDFYNALISKLGVESRTSKDQVENQELVLKNLDNLRQSVMGVNLDEEMANMVQFQHGYNAAAKVMQVFNEMLDQIINRLF